jgi:hypothetical protein
LKNDIRWISGRPFRFAARIFGTSWCFDYPNEPRLVIVTRLRPEERVDDDAPISRRLVVGADVIADDAIQKRSADWLE